MLAYRHTTRKLAIAFAGTEEEIEVSIQYVLHPATKGATGEFGVPLEPDSVAQVEIVRVDCRPDKVVCVNLVPILPMTLLDAIEADILEQQGEETI